MPAIDRRFVPAYHSACKNITQMLSKLLLLLHFRTLWNHPSIQHERAHCICIRFIAGVWWVIRRPWSMCIGARSAQVARVQHARHVVPMRIVSFWTDISLNQYEFPFSFLHQTCSCTSLLCIMWEEWSIFTALTQSSQTKSTVFLLWRRRYTAACHASLQIWVWMALLGLFITERDTTMAITFPVAWMIVILYLAPD